MRALYACVLCVYCRYTLCLHSLCVCMRVYACVVCVCMRVYACVVCVCMRVYACVVCVHSMPTAYWQPSQTHCTYKKHHSKHTRLTSHTINTHQICVCVCVCVCVLRIFTRLTRHMHQSTCWSSFFFKRAPKKKMRGQSSCRFARQLTKSNRYELTKSNRDE
jgi:hypothetical protein